MPLPPWLNQVGGALFNAVAQSEPVQAVKDGTPRRIADQLGQWFAHLSQNATAHWAPALLRRKSCEFCDAEAISTCIGCGGYVCLAHSHVSHRAELLCDECVDTVLTNVEAKQKSPVAKAFAFFHLTQDASWEEVNGVYRTRSREAHPDRGGSDQTMSEVNTHYDVLKKHFEKRKVA